MNKNDVRYEVYHVYVMILCLLFAGLSLVLNLEQNEYLSLFGQRTGARISISQPNVRPLPEEEGFMIRPGVETSVGLRLV